MTRFRMPLMAALLTIAVAHPAAAGLKEDWKDCNQYPDPDRGIAGCTRILKSGKVTSQGRAYAHNNRGNHLNNKQEYDRAIADYNEAIRLLPKNSFSYNGRGNAYYSKWEHDRTRSDFLDRALADYDRAIQINPREPNAHNGRGRVWDAKSDFNRAIRDYNEAIRLNPKLFFAYNNRGNAYRQKGEFELAIADFDEAVRLNPGHAFAYSGRADAWKEKGEFARAISDYNEAIRRNSNPYVPYNNRGLIWRDMGEYDRAIADFTESIRLNPRYDTPYSNRGEIWRLKGDLERALHDQDEAININPKNGTNFVLRGDTYRYKGEFDRALADYDRSLTTEVDNIPAHTGLGLTYERMGDLARARAEFEKAITSRSQSRSDISRSALETAKARLAALDSGIAPPVIPAAPSKAASPTAIPTPIAAVPAPPPATTAKQGRRVALVIGNSAYKTVPTLINPQRDAEKIAASLRAIGFDSVTLESDATREKLTNALRSFADEAEKADWAIVYYAGHGIEMNGVNYLVPVDARFATDRDVQFEALPFDQVMTALEGAKKLKLILLDACRDNPFAPQMRHTAAPAPVAAQSTAGAKVASRSIGRGLGEVKVSGATLVVYAAKHGQVALDGEGGNSPFVVAVVQRLATPGVEINKLFRLVRDDVMEATAGRQEPYTYGSLPGREDFFFVPPRVAGR